MEDCEELPFAEERSSHVICLFIMSGSQSTQETARKSHGKKLICTFSDGLEKILKVVKTEKKQKQDG